MVSRAKERNRATSPVILGWVVKKQYKTKSGRNGIKVVSKMFSSRGSAQSFMDYAVSGSGSDVLLFVSEVHGLDDLLQTVDG